jgi:hypothetical protein
MSHEERIAMKGSGNHRNRPFFRCLLASLSAFLFGTAWYSWMVGDPYLRIGHVTVTNRDSIGSLPR